MNKQTPLLVSGIIFLLIAIMHLARVIIKFNLVVADYPVPIWMNMVAVVVALVFAIWMFKARAS